MRIKYVILASWFSLSTFLSHQPGESTARTSRGLARKLSWMNTDTESLNGHLRSAAHFIIFFILTILTFWCFGFFGVAGAVVWAVLDEVTKIPVPGRHYSFNDVMKNMVGVCLGVLLVIVSMNTVEADKVTMEVKDSTVTTEVQEGPQRAVFAWDGVEDGDIEFLKSHNIDTLYINSTDFHTIPGFRCYLLAGDNRFTSSDIDGFMEQAVKSDAAGVVIDCEDWDRLPSVLEGVKNRSLPILICIPFWLEDVYGKGYVERVLTLSDAVVVMNYLKGYEAENIEYETQLCKALHKQIITAYELQPVGMYDLKEVNTYNKDGLNAVEENYRSMFSGTSVGLAYHNLQWMKKLENQ